VFIWDIISGGTTLGITVHITIIRVIPIRVFTGHGDGITTITAIIIMIIIVGGMGIMGIITIIIMIAIMPTILGIVVRYPAEYPM
jgi:hypothetical protein